MSTPGVEKPVLPEDEAIRDAVFGLKLGMKGEGAGTIDFAMVDPSVLGRIHERWLASRSTVGGKRSARARSGSFYTPPSLIADVLRRTLEPLLAERRSEALEKSRGGGSVQRGVRDIRVMDPAAGSGEFLRGVVRLLAREWASHAVEAGLEVGDERSLAREAARRCVFGIDIDPIAVHIARVSLWLDVSERGDGVEELALHMVHGNALLGVWNAHTHVHGASEPARRVDAVEMPTARKGRGGVDAAKDGAVPARLLGCDPRLHVQYEARFREVFGAGGEDAGFDAVVGNPPFVDSEAMSIHTPELREIVSRMFETARGNWDLCVPFVELAQRLVCRRGRFGLIIPSRLMSAEYAAGLQRLLLEKTTLTDCVAFEAADQFSEAMIAVAVIAGIRRACTAGDAVRFERAGGSSGQGVMIRQDVLRRLPPATLGAGFAAGSEGDLMPLMNGPTLGDAASVRDGATTAEAYLIRDILHTWDEHQVHAEREGDELFRLVNTGTIDPFVLRWAKDEIRYLGRRLARPVGSMAALEAIAPRRAVQARREKVVVAGLAGRIEAAVAPAGWLCGKSAVAVLPKSGVCVHALAAVLNSGSLNRLYRMLFGMRGFSERSIAVGAKQLARVPMPPVSMLAAADGEVASVGSLHTEVEAWLNAERHAQGRALLSMLGRAAGQAAERAALGGETGSLRELEAMIDRVAEACYAMRGVEGSEDGSGRE